MSRRHLTTFDEVLHAFGGPTALGRYVGRSASAVTNWRRETGRFPASLYWKMTHALHARAITADPLLWQFEDIDATATNTAVA